PRVPRSARPLMPPGAEICSAGEERDGSDGRLVEVGGAFGDEPLGVEEEEVGESHRGLGPVLEATVEHPAAGGPVAVDEDLLQGVRTGNDDPLAVVEVRDLLPDHRRVAGAVIAG